MKTIIAGSRHLWDIEYIRNAVKRSEFIITEVVSGCAPGVDRMGEKFAHENNTPVKKFPADWKAHGKAAGFKRNREMAEYAEALVAVWDGKSRGTMHMIKTARSEGLKNFVFKIPFGGF